MFGKTIWLPRFHVTNSRCEDVILLHFYLQMLNDINVKNSWERLRYKFQLKQITKSREKCCNLWKLHLRKMSFKFQNLSFNPMQNSILERSKAFNSKEKVKLGFSCICVLSLMCMFRESSETKFWSHRLGANCKKMNKKMVRVTISIS